MSNSKLVSYTRLSPNCTKPRNHSIDKITIHHMAGNLSVETCGAVFAPSSRQASSNYGIGSDGRAGLYVDEANRSWCSSNKANDNRAVTIEVANDQVGGNWHISDTALAKLIELCVDICKRNGIARLNYTGNKSGNLTMHKWFAATACPGPYLESKFPYIAEQVNARLAGASASDKTAIMGKAVATAAQMQSYIKRVNAKVAQSVLDMIPLYLTEGAAEGVRGDVAFAQSCLETGNFTFAGSAVTLGQNNFCGMGVTSNGVMGNSFTSPQLGIRAQVQHLKAYASTAALANGCIDPRFKYVTRGSAEYVEWLGQKENPNGLGWAAGEGYGTKILAILKSIASTAAEADKPISTVPYTVRVAIADLNIRKGPGTNYATTGKFTGKGVFTIVEETSGKGATKWGRLKSGAGWISLDYAAKN
jgi:hypothetical protein